MDWIDSHMEHPSHDYFKAVPRDTANALHYLNYYYPGYTCPCCYQFLFRPVLCVFCSSVCCEACSHLAASCYNCHEQFGTDSPLPSRELSRLFQDNISLDCTICQTSCVWGDAINHTQECWAFIIPCKHASCPEKCSRMEMKRHLSECSFHPVACPDCQNMFTRGTLPGHQLQCPQKMTQCRHCQETYRLINEPLHVINCREIPIRCKCCREVVKQGDFWKHVLENRRVKEHLLYLGEYC